MAVRDTNSWQINIPKFDDGKLLENHHIIGMQQYHGGDVKYKCDLRRRNYAYIEVSGFETGYFDTPAQVDKNSKVDS